MLHARGNHSVRFLSALLAVTILLSIVTVQVGAQKSPRFAWQEGRLETEYLVGRMGMPLKQQWRYQIVTPDYAFEADIWLPGTSGLNVTQGGVITFSFTSSGFYIKDDDGKTHKMTFVKKTQR
jgi:hypothetical protein